MTLDYEYSCINSTTTNSDAIIWKTKKNLSRFYCIFGIESISEVIESERRSYLIASKDIFLKILRQCSLWWKLNLFWLLFRKSPNSFFSCYSFYCTLFSAPFLSVSRLYFFFIGLLSYTCYCTVSTYFQISFNNFLPKKQANENQWKK